MVAFAAIAQGVKIGTAIVSRRKRRRAVKLQRTIRAISNVQRKRAFLNRFRSAQAETLIAGVASGAGLESSGVQATLASQVTQRNIGVSEFEEQQRLSQRATQELASAESLDFFGGLVGQAGDIAAAQKTGR